MNEEIRKQIEDVLDQVRPILSSDGGGIELVGFDEETGIVQVIMQGACAGCPMASITLKMCVEATLQEALPFIKEVISIDHEEA